MRYIVTCSQLLTPERDNNNIQSTAETNRKAINAKQKPIRTIQQRRCRKFYQFRCAYNSGCFACFRRLLKAHLFHLGRGTYSKAPLINSVSYLLIYLLTYLLI